MQIESKAALPNFLFQFPGTPGAMSVSFKLFRTCQSQSKGLLSATLLVRSTCNSSEMAKIGPKELK